MSTQDDRLAAGPPAKRCPRRALTLLAFGTWGLALLNAGRAWQEVRNVSLLSRWEPAWPSWTLAALSAAWVLVWLAAGWGLVRRRPWGRRLALALPPAYGLFRIATVLLTSATPYSRGRWLWLLIGWILATLLVGWVVGFGPLRRCFRPAPAAPVVPYPWPKRLTDRLLPGLLLLLAAPLLLLVLAGMAVDMALRPADRGPFFYCERRISCGRPFDLLKFRVLRADVVAGAAGHVRRYEKDLDNLTWAGRHLIKRWYLDELPQLWNILRGDMSLVGPRPWPVAMVEDQVERGVTYRLHVHAGWTGPAQLQKGAENPIKGETLDLQYVDRCRRWPGWRLWRYDLAVLARTLRVMAQGKGLRY